MSDHPGTYKGKRITVESNYEDPKLLIEDEKVDVTRDPDSSTFGTVRLPYREFESIEDLAKAIIDAES